MCVWRREIETRQDEMMEKKEAKLYRDKELKRKWWVARRRPGQNSERVKREKSDGVKEERKRSKAREVGNERCGGVEHKDKQEARVQE